MKKRLLCPAFPKPHTPVPLSDDEAHHAIHVLRLRDQDTIEILDGNGHRGLARLRTRGGPVRVEWLAPDPKEGGATLTLKDSPLPITLEMAVLKGDAMEWIVEKAVELGIGKLVPVLTAHTVVQIKNKGPAFYQERWQKIADQALKQCGRASRLTVLPPISLESLIMGGTGGTEGSIGRGAETAHKKEYSFMRLWCDEKSSESSEEPSSYLLDWLRSRFPLLFSEVKILIGPEGGWSMSERQLLLQESHSRPLQRIDLGPLVLRAETAALFAASLISAHLRCNQPVDAESLAKNSSFL